MLALTTTPLRVQARGQTALHYCHKYKFQEMARLLEQFGANDTLTNQDGLTCYEGLSKRDLEDWDG